MRRSRYWFMVVAHAGALVTGCLSISETEQTGAPDSGSGIGGSGTGGIGTDAWAGGGSAQDGSGGMAGGSAGAQAFAARGVVFDGLEDWLDLQSGFTGVTDGTQVSGSLWFKRIGVGENYCIGPEAAGSPAPHQLEWTAGNHFHIQWRKSGGGTACDLSSSPITDTSSWHHIAFSIDVTDFTKSRLFVDGVEDLATNFVGGSTLDNTGSQWGLFADQAGDLKYRGEVAEFWLALGEYLDLSDPQNLEKFRANGKPVDLGAKGELPTGTAPTIYLSLRPNDGAELFTFNRGVGGTFVPHGQLDLSLTSPSD